MVKKYLSTFFLFILISILWGRNGFSWNDSITHRNLSEYAAEQSVLSTGKGDYLKNIGFNNNLDEYVKWNGSEWKVREWIREGALQEDVGTNWQGFTGQARYLNHFHNPLKPWAEAGLSGVYNGKSSVLWAQDTATQAGWLGGDWSWPTTRSRYYKALTSLTDTERQAYFAQTFRGLGQIIHLLQDMAQPAHVSNEEVSYV